MSYVQPVHGETDLRLMPREGEELFGLKGAR